ncbi:hypothetical protein SAMN05444360_105148 [Chryseobacterium carnipullorum]|uniref:hypothetical protein n=1 Tax=Chryseobacterium carnipullorum TaxID=1124835 RepID=UPI000922099B|nr:hypothetical protein [Chryseobacterium carnipullorum]SHL87638.1 hypothetical protein SAMN05444360_105148 [Chryseobacterium carnipullorum]
MKKILKIIPLFILIIVSNRAYAQLDTLNYLKQFEANKAQYIGQPFSKLVSDMNQITPKTVWPTFEFNNKKNVEESMFKFCKKEHSFKNSIILRIVWYNEIPYSQIQYYQNKNQFYFTDEERLFYGSKIVKDIKVYRW